VLRTYIKGEDIISVITVIRELHLIYSLISGTDGLLLMIIELLKRLVI